MAALWAGLAAGRDSPARRYLAAGALAGIAILVAPKAVLLLLLLALAAKRRRTWRATLRPVALTVLAAVAVVLPWTVRNLVQMDGMVPVSTNGGVNLWIGNNPGANGGWISWDGTGSWTYPLNERATDSQRQREAITYVLENPVATAALWPDKVRAAFGQDYMYLRHFTLSPRDSPLPHWLPLKRLARGVNDYYDVVLRAGLAGAFILAVIRRRTWLLLTALGILASPIIFFFGMDRYHVELLPLLAILAAGGARELVRACASYGPPATFDLSELASVK